MLHRRGQPVRLSARFRRVALTAAIALGGVWGLASALHESPDEAEAERDDNPSTSASAAFERTRSHAPETAPELPPVPPPGFRPSLEEDLIELRARSNSPPADAVDAAITALARRIESDSAASWAIQRLLEADAAGDRETAQILNAAIGRVRDVGTIVAALDVYPRLSNGISGHLLYAVAQNRGAARTDPNLPRHFGRFVEFGEIPEPEIRSRLLDVVTGPQRRVPSQDAMPAGSVLALSAHLDAEFDSVLRRALTGGGSTARTVALVYLSASRSPGVVDEALTHLASETSDADVVRASVGALRRLGYDARRIVDQVSADAAAEDPARRVRACRALAAAVIGLNDASQSVEVVVAPLVRLVHDSDTAVSNAALHSISAIAAKSGGWTSHGLDPEAYVRSGDLPLEGRAAVARSWGRCYAVFGDHEGAFLSLLFDREVPGPIRVDAWKGVQVESRSDSAKDRVASILGRARSETLDPGIREIVRDVAARTAR